MFNVGDLVKINLNYILSISGGLVPSWYSSDSFEIIKINYTVDNFGDLELIGNRTVLIDKMLIIDNFSCGNEICVDYLILDTSAIRRKKLKQLEVSNV